MSISKPVRAAALVFAALLTTAPVFAAQPSDVPEIQSWRTDNGARVLFIAADSVPMVNARVTFAAGAARDGDLPGQARLTADALLSGTGERDADAVAAALDQHGAEVDTGAARDMAWLSLTSLAADDQLWPTVEVLRQILGEPAFPEGEVDRLIGQQRTSLQREQQSPGAIANRRFWETAYEGHPYASNPLGTSDSLDAIEPDHLAAFHEQYYVAENATVAIVGAIERSGAERLANELVGALPGGAPAQALPAPPELEEDVTVRESFPSTQAHIMIGRPGVARGEEDKAAFHVADHVFGSGSFTNRLFNEVRKERGLVYGVRSNSTAMAAAGPYRIGLQTRGDQESEALEVVRDELDKFLDGGPTEDETETAVQNIVGGFPLLIDANSSLVGHLSVIGFYDLPLDHLATYPRRVEDVDPDVAHQAFVDVLGGKPRVTVIVGGDRARDD